MTEENILFHELTALLVILFEEQAVYVQNTPWYIDE